MPAKNEKVKTPVEPSARDFMKGMKPGTPRTVSFIRIASLCFVAHFVADSLIAFGEDLDLRYGTLTVPDGYKMFHTGTLDSFQGRLVRTEDKYTISFDIGMMAGAAVGNLGTTTTPVFFRRSSINGIESATEIKNTKDGLSIVTTIGYDAKKGVEPANFQASASTQADVAEFLTIVGTYKSK